MSPRSTARTALLLLCALDLAAASTTIALPSEVTNFVPTCAISCLSSFINADFPASLCGQQPTLQCLCAHTGSNGFTLGEGAISCVAYESGAGQCSGDDASSSASVKAYSMCHGEQSAVAETHATLLATLVIPAQTSVQTTTTSTKTTTKKTTTSPRRTTTATATATSSTTASHSSSPTLSSVASTSATSGDAISSSASTSTTSSAGGESSAAAAQQTSSGSKSVSAAKIAGIAVGSSIAAILVVGMFIVAHHRRRQMLADFPDEAGMGTAKPSGGSDGGRNFRNSNPLGINISAPMNLEPQGSFRKSRGGGGGGTSEITRMAISLGLASPARAQTRPMSSRPFLASAGSQASSRYDPGQEFPQAAQRFPENPARGNDAAAVEAAVTTAVMPAAPTPPLFSLASPSVRRETTTTMLDENPLTPPAARTKDGQASQTNSFARIETNTAPAPDFLRPGRRPIASLNRDSIVTEFAEDGEFDSLDASGSRYPTLQRSLAQFGGAQYPSGASSSKSVAVAGAAAAAGERPGAAAAAGPAAMMGKGRRYQDLPGLPPNTPPAIRLEVNGSQALASPSLIPQPLNVRSSNASLLQRDYTGYNNAESAIARGAAPPQQPQRQQQQQQQSPPRGSPPRALDVPEARTTGPAFMVYRPSQPVQNGQAVQPSQPGPYEENYEDYYVYPSAGYQPPQPPQAQQAQQPSAGQWNGVEEQPSPSSMLAKKRLGTERAARLILGNGNDGTQRRPQKAGWSQLGPGGEPRSQQWPPTMPQTDSVMNPGLPATPGWTPQITPSRSGRDLYLRVG